MTYQLFLLDHPLQLCVLLLQLRVLLLDHCVLLLDHCVLLLDHCVLLLDHCVLLPDHLLLAADGGMVFIGTLQGGHQDRLVGKAACTAQNQGEAMNTESG